MFIGGDMPYIVKRMVCILKGSSKKKNKNKSEYDGKVKS